MTYLSPEAIAALKRLEFNTENVEKNFVYDRDLKSPPDFGEIARFMIVTMHDAYGARAEIPLSFRAPFVRKIEAKCNT